MVYDSMSFSKMFQNRSTIACKNRFLLLQDCAPKSDRLPLSVILFSIHQSRHRSCCTKRSLKSALDVASSVQAFCTYVFFKMIKRLSLMAHVRQYSFYFSLLISLFIYLFIYLFITLVLTAMGKTSENKKQQQQQNDPIATCW